MLHPGLPAPGFLPPAASWSAPGRPRQGRLRRRQAGAPRPM